VHSGWIADAVKRDGLASSSPPGIAMRALTPSRKTNDEPVAGETTRNQTVAIVKRSATATLQGSSRAALEITCAAAQRQNMSVTVTGIPAAYPFGGLLDFDASRMEALFEYGERCALAGQSWTDPFDALDPLPPSPSRQQGNVQCPSADLHGETQQHPAARDAQCRECVRASSAR
jgi:hypothetical protein